MKSFHCRFTVRCKAPNRAALATPMQQICNRSITTTFGCGLWLWLTFLCGAAIVQLDMPLVHFFLLCTAGLRPAKQNKSRNRWCTTTKAPQWCNDVIYHHFKKSGLQEECCKSLILKQWYHYLVKFSFSLIFLVLAYWENNAFLVGPKLCLVSWLKI